MKRKYFCLYLLCLFLWTSCSDDDADPSFTITTASSTVTLDPDSDSETTVSFTSTRDWTAKASDSWFTISPTSGGDGTSKITITTNSDNTTGSYRSSTIILTSLTVTDSIVVKQEPFIYLEQSEYTVSAEGGTLDIIFSTDLDMDDVGVYVYYSGNWITSVNGQSRSTSYYIRLNIVANTDGSARTAYLKFIKESSNGRFLSSQTELATVTVIQEGIETATSTDYSADKTVTTLQTATIGNGIPIIIMGDGFIDTEIADGTYDEVMNQAMENLFSEEPVASLRDYFDIYSVTAVSTNNLFGKSYSTAFSCSYDASSSTLIEGDDEAVQEYAQCVDGVDLTKALVVVILNSKDYAGTTYFGYYTSDDEMTDFSIAYCPTVYGIDSEYFRCTLVHEAIGHGLAFLNDEYSYESYGRIPNSEIEDVKNCQTTYGWFKNVDFTTDETEVLWSAFISDERYDDEDVGIYEGAYGYVKGIYRSSEDSMMNNNVLGFNPPSRQLLYNKVMELGLGTDPDYEEFVAFDMTTKSSTTTSSNTRSVDVSMSFNQLPAPRRVNKVLNSSK